ncbi:MAG: hypothetical protein EBS56_05480 [Planctomycetia bacterium]|nr:hypothetical protein [Planctomycetia bacterium]
METIMQQSAHPGRSGALLIAVLIVLCPTAAAVEPLPEPPSAPGAGPLPEICPVPTGANPLRAMETARGFSVSSCSSTACHGGPKAGNHDVQSFAATLWVDGDPHARAYEVLHDPRSQRMARLLGIGPAHQARQCLACHSVQAESRAPLPKGVLADGVGCAACHGDATQWESRHFLPEWKMLSPAERASLGYRELGSPRERADTCVRCHVGASDREVDHDLIAAGHPRLFFELATFQRLWPRHWSPRDRAEAAADFTERSWAVGQAAALQAVAELLDTRAQRAVRAVEKPMAAAAKPWPEFAEFDCYSCHRSLGPNADVQDHRARPRPPGAPTWQPWYVAAALLLENQVGTESSAARELAAEFAEVRRLLDAGWADADEERLRRIRFEARGMAAAADRLATELSARPVVVLDGTPASFDRMVAARPDEWHRWDGAVQALLALEASRAGGPARHDGRPPPRVRSALEALRDSLRFPPGVDAPLGFDAERFQRARADIP